MAYTYTDSNGLPMPAKGDFVNTWATFFATYSGLVDQALDGWLLVGVSGSKTLTDTDGATNEARNRQLAISGTGGTLTFPNVEKLYLIDTRAATGPLTCTIGSGTTAVIAQGSMAILSVNTNGCFAGHLTRTGSVLLSTTNITAVNSFDVTVPAGFTRYRAVIENIRQSTGSSKDLTVRVMNSAAGSYTEVYTMTSGTTFLGHVSAEITPQLMVCGSELHSGATGNAIVYKPGTQLAMTNFNFTLSAGNFDANGTVKIEAFP